MTTIYLVRHGRTEWNQAGRLQGAHGDSPLLAESYQQIKQLATYLRPIDFARAFVSPIKRAQDTARLTLADMQVSIPLTTLVDLREFEMGIWEGLTYEEAKANHPAMFAAYRTAPQKFVAQEVPGAESFQGLQDRVSGAIQTQVQRYGGHDVNLLFFSHGMALTAGINGLLGQSIDHLRDAGGLGNTSTTVLKTNDGRHYDLVVRNDTHYLTDVKQGNDNF